MIPIWIFDIDGTLTPSRGVIDNEFKDELLHFIEYNKVFLVSGSDYSKSEEQLGSEILTSVERVYSCAGNSVWEEGSLLYENDWMPDSEHLDFFIEEFKNSKYPGNQVGRHIELRPGFVNFSILGRANATIEDRAFYKRWDALVKERKGIASRFNSRFPHLQASIGGETGVDIHPKGNDKSQILSNMPGATKDRGIYFVGDAIEKGGNDYEIAESIKVQPRGSVFKVNDWTDTQEIIRNNWALREELKDINHDV